VKLTSRITVVGALLCVGMMGLVASTASAATPASKHATTHLSLPQIHIAGPADAVKGSIPIQYSGNWSGYIALPKNKAAKSFKYIQTDFTVPAVDCDASPDSFSYHWVGLDGDTDGTVEQDGIAADCPGGTTPQYFAWWETYPDGINSVFSVNPGDAIEAEVYYDAGEYYLFVWDETTGNYFDNEEACASGSTCYNSSAEVITEGYYANSYYAGTSDFVEVNYSNIEIEDQANKTGGLVNSNWNTDESIAVGQSDNIDTEPGPVAQTTKTKPIVSSFPIYWYEQN
jgi:hypothetical protein